MKTLMSCIVCLRFSWQRHGQYRCERCDSDVVGIRMTDWDAWWFVLRERVRMVGLRWAEYRARRRR